MSRTTPLLWYALPNAQWDWQILKCVSWVSAVHCSCNRSDVSQLQCLLCKDSFMPPDKLWMHSPTHMSDLDTCYPQPYILSKSVIVCSIESEIIRPTGTWWTCHSRRGTKNEVISLWRLLFTLLKPILAVIWEAPKVRALKQCFLGLKWICEYHLKSWETHAQRLDLPELTKTMKEV